MVAVLIGFILSFLLTWAGIKARGAQRDRCASIADASQQGTFLHPFAERM